MANGVFKKGTKRDLILLAVLAVTMFIASSLSPGEPAAQTASPNGKIVYSGFDTTLGDDGLGQEDIYTMNPDGTGVTNLTKNYSMPNWSPLGTSKDNPEWSPDGAKIVFDAGALSDIGSCCSRNVYVMDADGANLERLTNTPSVSDGQDFDATWASDGSWLAFTSTRNDPYDDRDIYRMDADGTKQLQLTTVDPASEEPPARVTDEQPSVSPDGTKIAFASNTHWDDPTSDDYHVDELDIYVMDASDGDNVRRLTFDASGTSPTHNLVSQSQAPAWSPDGTRIAYESTRSGNSEIWVMNSDGTGEPVNVSNDPAWDSEPAWSPDGTQITFTRGTGQSGDIWAVDAPPPSLTTPATALLPLLLGTNTAWAAAEPRNLTANTSVKAGSPDWGTAPLGGGTACTIEGTSGSDTLTGTSGADKICGLGGNDAVFGAGGADTVKGGSGNDTLVGEGGGDRLVGNGGADKLLGGNGDDTVNSKDDVSGNDMLDGGSHVDGDVKATDATEKSVVRFP